MGGQPRRRPPHADRALSAPLSADLDSLLADPPALHRDMEGNPISYAVTEELARFLAEAAGPGSRTLETGAGLSTLVFAMSGCDHTCVLPDPELAERIRAWCAANGVDTAGLGFELGPSERALPVLEPGPLDLVLIDGRHAFPSPFIDWYYAAPMLQEGGVLVVDDTQLWTGRVLRDFMDEDPRWELRGEPGGRSAVFRTLAAIDHADEWLHQPYVATRSRPSLASRLVSRLRRS